MLPAHNPKMKLRDQGHQQCGDCCNGDQLRSSYSAQDLHELPERNKIPHMAAGIERPYRPSTLEHVVETHSRRTMPPLSPQFQIGITIMRVYSQCQNWDDDPPGWVKISRL